MMRASESGHALARSREPLLPLAIFPFNVGGLAVRGPLGISIGAGKYHADAFEGRGVDTRALDAVVAAMVGVKAGA
jgi:hypothetical protein